MMEAYLGLLFKEKGGVDGWIELSWDNLWPNRLELYGEWEGQQKGHTL